MLFMGSWKRDLRVLYQPGQRGQHLMEGIEHNTSRQHHSSNKYMDKE